MSADLYRNERTYSGRTHSKKWGDLRTMSKGATDMIQGVPENGKF